MDYHDGMRAPLFTVALAFAACLAPLTAYAAPSAKDKANAKAFASDARAAARAGRYTDAAAAFEGAIAVDPSAQLRLELARAYAQIGKLVEAKAALTGAIDDAAKSSRDKKVGDVAKRLLGDVEPRIPSLRILFTGKVGDGEGSAKIDRKAVDTDVAVPLDPGDHVVTGSAEGFEATERTITLAEGAHETVKLKLKKIATGPVAVKEESEGGGSKVPAILSLSVGVLGVGVGAVFGVMAMSDKSTADKSCKGTVCSPAAQGSIDSSLAKGNVSTVAFIVGGVGLALGTVLLVIAPGSKKDTAKPEEASIEPWVGAGSAGLRGRF